MSFIVCVAVCVVFFEHGVLFCVMYTCVLSITVVPLPPGKTPFLDFFHSLLAIGITLDSIR
jgi:hypothetical protein